MENNRQFFFNAYIGAGNALNDKDRNINSDLVEIHDFFKPIDRLFGDYEIRKKFNLQEILYRTGIDGFEVRIQRDKLEEMRNDSNNLILFTIINLNGIYVVQHDWVNPEKVCDVNYSDRDVVAQYILDPIKFYNLIDIEESRFNSYCDVFLKKTNEVSTEDIRKFIEYYSTIKRFFARHRRYLRINFGEQMDRNSLKPIEQDEYYTKKSENLEMINHAINCVKKSNIPSIEEIMEDLDKEKVKNFERFSQIRIRLGKHEDGRFVLFLHPYESESNNPLEIPTRR